MKPILYLSLAALGLASALPPDSIPVQCATICGPIVDLSARCAAPRLRRRQFQVIVPAPTTFPPSLHTPSTPAAISSTSSISSSSTKRVPVERESSTTAERSTRTRREQPTTLLVDPDTEHLAEQEMQFVAGSEAECVCYNASFDVATVAGLCASCVALVEGGGSNNADVILNTCGFERAKYQPSADEVVLGVSVDEKNGGFEAESGAKGRGARRLDVLFGVVAGAFLLL